MLLIDGITLKLIYAPLNLTQLTQHTIFFISKGIKTYLTANVTDVASTFYFCLSTSGASQSRYDKGKFMPVIKAATHFLHLTLLILCHGLHWSASQPICGKLRCESQFGTVVASCSKIIDVTNVARGPCFRSKMAVPQISLKEISTREKHSQ